ncbi:MAG: Glu-tRNA(Gln) amidotransferase subunit GatE [Nanoarchaeota archaeon]|nr:Glu-tRNA(Gln) amidotransferase subunit GatE [Nanoarchaeota archaeon]
MAEKIDYKKLGFKCGIEIHQQLDTHKLFCKCLSIVHDTHPDIKFTRKLRPVPGETGEIDAAAIHEVLKGKYYAYEACSTSCCLIEMDEEPPHPMNMDALKIVLEVAKHLNASIVDEIQVMRKTVIDGSNVSGFQRTALVAQNGYIDTSKGRVRIPAICLEEEAAKKLEATDKYTKYRLDRLGIPLIELATEPDIIDPEHAKEAAEKLGMILRSTNKVKRGIGTIRQDVNVSIKKGARTEIKGFQNLKSIPKVIEKEVERQLRLIKNGKKIDSGVRKAEPDFSTTFLRPMPGASRMYPETDVIPVKICKDDIEISELIEVRRERYIKKYHLSSDLATITAGSPFAKEYETAVKNSKNLKPAFIAENIFVSPIKEIRRKSKIDIPLNANTANILIEVTSLIDKGDIQKDSDIINKVIIEKYKGTFDINKHKGLSDDELEKEVRQVVADNKDSPIGALMGKIMARHRGKVDGKKVMDLLKKFAK